MSADLILMQFLEHKDDLTCLAASPALALLASGGLSSQAFLWDVNVGTKVHQVLAVFPIGPAPEIPNSQFEI